MQMRIVAWTVIGVLAVIVPAAAQAPSGPPQRGQPPYGQPQYGQPAGPAYPSGQMQYAPSPSQGPATQPGRTSLQYPAAPLEAVVPRDPQLQRRTPPRQGPSSPFVLSPQQQAELDQLLTRWEQRGAEVKNFECKFTRFDWDPVWRTDQPMHVVQGEIRYAAPDKGMIVVDGEIVDFRWERGQAVGGRFVKGQQAEHWICDGKSVFEYDFRQKQLVEHKLPADLQGKAIHDGPLPFLFGSTAEQLEQRYFLRVVTPQGAKDQVWLEAYPKYQADAANFWRATLILSRGDMQPSAVELVLPNAQTGDVARAARTVYNFHKPKTNVANLLDPLGVFENNWLHARLPSGWTKRVEEASPTQAAQVPAPDRR
jgi:TIGR03009 family protein